MFISTIISRVLQSLEFLRYNVGSWFLAVWNSSIIAKICIVVTFIWGCIKTVISIYAQFCLVIQQVFTEMHFSGVRTGGVDVVALANTVLPLDELMAFIVTWFAIKGACVSIKFIRAAWAAVPLKAT